MKKDKIKIVTSIYDFLDIKEEQVNIVDRSKEELLKVIIDLADTGDDEYSVVSFRAKKREVDAIDEYVSKLSEVAKHKFKRSCFVKLAVDHFMKTFKI